MFSFKVHQLSEFITAITDPTGVFMFLIQGKQKALLVDTGVGFAGLKETVDTLTDLPLTVVLTHMHPDHAGGAAAFPQVYIHPADIPAFREQTLESRIGFAQRLLPVMPTASDMLPPVEEEDHFLPLEDGQVFDLGGICAEIVHVPGHTPGSCCILFREERAMLLGDACNANTLILWDMTISTYRESLKRLQLFRPQFDKVYYSHGMEPEGPDRSIEDNIELCGKILNAEDEAIPCQFMQMPALRAAAIDTGFRRLDGKYGNIVYREDARK